MVCNAGSVEPTPIDDVTAALYDRYMAVSARGPFFLIQHAGRMLRDGGRIICVPTLNTRVHAPGTALAAC